MAGGWWGENREGRTWEGKGRTREGRWKGRKDEGGKDMEGRGKGRTREGRRKGRKDERRIRERGSRFLWDNSKRIVYKFFMGC